MCAHHAQTHEAPFATAAAHGPRAAKWQKATNPKPHTKWRTRDDFRRAKPPERPKGEHPPLLRRPSGRPAAQSSQGSERRTAKKPRTGLARIEMKLSQFRKEEKGKSRRKPLRHAHKRAGAARPASTAAQHKPTTNRWRPIGPGKAPGGGRTAPAPGTFKTLWSYQEFWFGFQEENPKTKRAPPQERTASDGQPARWPHGKPTKDRGIPAANNGPGPSTLT